MAPSDSVRADMRMLRDVWSRLYPQRALASRVVEYVKVVEQSTPAQPALHLGGRRPTAHRDTQGRSAHRPTPKRAASDARRPITRRHRPAARAENLLGFDRRGPHLAYVDEIPRAQAPPARPGTQRVTSAPGVSDRLARSLVHVQPRETAQLQRDWRRTALARETIRLRRVALGGDMGRGGAETTE
jgi:hypothetical protein